MPARTWDFRNGASDAREGRIWRLVDGTPVPVTSEELGMVAEMLADPATLTCILTSAEK